MSGPRVAAFVPSVRPHLLARLLESWRATENVAGIDLHICAQREPAEQFEEAVEPYRDVIARYEYRPLGGPVWPVRAGWMGDHGEEADVWVLMDDDFELLPGMTNWWPAIDRAHSDPSVGVVSCNWARSEKFIRHRMPSEEWVKQPVVNMSGGMVFRSEVAGLMARTREVPWMWDDTMVGLVAYLEGLENWRYRGSLLIHRILQPGGIKVVQSSTALQPLDPRYVVGRACKPVFGGEAAINNMYIPVSSDLTPLAREIHRRAKEQRRKP